MENLVFTLCSYMPKYWQGALQRIMGEWMLGKKEKPLSQQEKKNELHLLSTEFAV